jgi:replicative DNA helicase
MENPSKKAFLWLSEDRISLCKSRAIQICKLLNQDEKILNSIVISDSFPKQLLKKNRGNYEIDSSFEYIKSELRAFDMIVFDPLLAFYGGDENDNSQARTFMQPFMNWANTTNKSIVLLHHSSKSHMNENRSRGAGAFIDACRLLYEIDKVYISSGDKRKLDSSKLHMRTIKLSKDNYGAIKHLKNFEVLRHVTPLQSSSQMTIQENKTTTI